MKNLLFKTVMLGSKFQKADIRKSFLIGDILNSLTILEYRISTQNLRMDLHNYLSSKKDQYSTEEI